ncbi:MAG: hypothetical protein D6731_23215 [Planctomycetota bacterium]|nr:MAG: hypothetical protein D6731_23215 [Planctomycetota bacterium]
MRPLRCPTALCALLLLTACPASPPGGGSGAGPTGTGDAGSAGSPQDSGEGATPDTQRGASSAAPGEGGRASVDPDLAAVRKRAPLPDPTLERWAKAALEVPPERFVPVERARDALKRVLVESKGATSWFLRPEVDPHRGAKAAARWKAYPAPAEGMDLLRCDFEAGGLSLRLTEGANLLVVRAAPLDEQGPLDADRLGELVDKVVRTEREEGTWRFSLPREGLGAGTHLLTSADAPPVAEIGTRDDRADILVVEGRVFFVFYKKIAQRLGFEPDDAWFPPRARAALGG